MNFFSRWLWAHPTRREAMSLYKRGLARAQKNDVAGAAKAYTAAIELPGSPDDVKAMALYNRALLLAAGEHPDQALADLQIVMELPMSPSSVKVAARRRLERLQHRRDMEQRPTKRPSS